VMRSKRLETWLEAHRDKPIAGDGPGPLAAALEPFRSALANDLNIAGAIGVLNDAASKHNIESDPPTGDGGATYADELDALPDDAVENSFGCGNPLAFAGVEEGDTANTARL